MSILVGIGVFIIGGLFGALALSLCAISAQDSRCQSCALDQREDKTSLYAAARNGPGHSLE